MKTLSFSMGNLSNVLTNSKAKAINSKYENGSEYNGSKMGLSIMNYVRSWKLMPRILVFVKQGLTCFPINTTYAKIVSMNQSRTRSVYLLNGRMESESTVVPFAQFEEP